MIRLKKFREIAFSRRDELIESINKQTDFYRSNRRELVFSRIEFLTKTKQVNHQIILAIDEILKIKKGDTHGSPKITNNQ